MTSGEWDLRALKALEEEEQAEFLSISDSNLLDIPPPPPLHKKVLPTIKEHCSDTTVPTEDEEVVVPKTILSSLSSSSASASASETSSLTPTFFKRNKKLFKKNCSSHPYKGLFKTTSNSILQIGNNNYSSDFDIDCIDSNTFVPSPKTLDSKEMMTMMMFLSSSQGGGGGVGVVGATPEVANSFIEDELLPKTSSFFQQTSHENGNLFSESDANAINKSDNRKKVHVNLCSSKLHEACSKKCSNGGNKSLLPSQSPLIDGLGNTVKLTTSTLGITSSCTSPVTAPVVHRCSESGDNNENIVDELEEHIKHCSCSCNHMGYGNSMDYQVGCISHILM